MTPSKPATEHPQAGIDPRIPNLARIYNALLGGKDNYAVDRECAAELLKLLPSAESLARANRHFLARAVRYLAGEVGIDQFIDIGAGLPTPDNTHKIAQRTNHSARVVYVDNDPVVLAHGRALFESHGLTAVIKGDLRDPAAIIDHPDTQALIDFTQPVAIILASVLHFVEGSEAGQITGLWWQALAPGSCLVISHAEDRPELADAARLCRKQMKTGHPRSRKEIKALFAGFHLIDPGVVALPLWQPETSSLPEGAEDMPMLGGIALRTSPSTDTDLMTSIPSAPAHGDGCAPRGLAPWSPIPRHRWNAHVSPCGPVGHAAPHLSVPTSMLPLSVPGTDQAALSSRHLFIDADVLCTLG